MQSAKEENYRAYIYSRAKFGIDEKWDEIFILINVGK
jgi:hypothetical protein